MPHTAKASAGLAAPPPAKVLVVEDEAKLARVFTAYLAEAGYRTLQAADGEAGLELWRREAPDCILLDINLPRIDGITVCKTIRAESSVPIAMVTARVDEIDRLLGLEIGADDYICKPASPREVVARVKALLRRATLTAKEAVAQQGIDIDNDNLQVRIDGKPLQLTALEFRLFATLAKRPGRVYSRNQLIDAVHGDNRELVDRTVDSHIRNLRRKIEQVAPDGEVIRSVYGVGYALDPRAADY